MVPGYTEKILGLLLRHTEHPNAAQLAVLFIEATKPALDNSEKMTLHMNAMIQTDLDAAFKYQVMSTSKIRIDSSVPHLKLFGRNYLQVSSLRQ